MKITGGTLKVKELLITSKGNVAAGEEVWEEKADQIRIYSGARFELVKEVPAGTVCAVTGLSHTFPGQGLGVTENSNMPVLEPVLNYQIILSEGCDVHPVSYTHLWGRLLWKRDCTRAAGTDFYKILL